MKKLMKKNRIINKKQADENKSIAFYEISKIKMKFIYPLHPRTKQIIIRFRKYL